MRYQPGRQQRRQQIAQCTTADIAQEHPRLRQIEWQEAQAATRHGQREHTPGIAKHHCEPQRAQQGLARGQAVDAIHEVPGIDQHDGQHERGDDRHRTRTLPVHRPCQAGGGDGMHQQTRPCGQWPMVVPPTDAGHQQQARCDQPPSLRLRGSMADRQQRQQAGDRDADPATTWCRRGVAPTLARVIKQVVPVRVSDRPAAAKRRDHHRRHPRDRRQQRLHSGRLRPRHSSAAASPFPTPCSWGIASDGCAHRNRSGCTDSSGCAPATGR